jgi:hypothetical protein
LTILINLNTKIIIHRNKGIHIEVILPSVIIKNKLMCLTEHRHQICKAQGERVHVIFTVKRMRSLFEPHTNVYVFHKFSMKGGGRGGGALMRKRCINCKPQLRYTCYLYLILFFRGDVDRKKSSCWIFYVNKGNELAYWISLLLFLPHQDISVFHMFGEGVAIAKY